MTVPIDFKGSLERLVKTTHERLGCSNTGTGCEVHQVTYGPDGCPVALEQAHERHRRGVLLVTRYWNRAESPSRGDESMIDLGEVLNE